MRTAVERPAVEAAAPSRGTGWRSGYLRRAPGIIATISALLGLLALLGALDPHERFRVHAITRVIPVPASAAATAVSVVAGLLLLRLAAALRKRKRRAWRAAVVIAAVMTVAHVVRGVRVGEAVISVILLVLLITARSRYTAKSDPRSRWFAVLVFFQFTGVAIVYGMLMLYAYRDRLVGHPSFWAQLREVLFSLVGGGGGIGMRGERFDDIFHATLFGFGLLTTIAVALLALRPSEPIARLSPQDEDRLRTLLAKQGGRDSLGYFALRRDKSVVWSPTGKAAITYRVVQGVALASGDPIGDPEAWPGAMDAYRQLVDEYGWTAAVIGCSELGATIYKRECDLSALAFGDEAIVEAGDFTLEGRPMRGVRQACTRVCRAGYEVRVRRAGEIGREEMAELVRAAAAWRGDAVERGFSMALSRLGDPSDPDCVVATAHQNGVLAGVLHFVPWGDDGLSLDLMRRNRSSDNGLNEFMIAKVIEDGGDLGVRRVSLNFAAFRDAIERGERIGAGPILRAWRWVLIFLSRWWQIETLYRFNVKFRPYWEPRFISYPSSRDLPRIAIAALEAEAFIVRPHRLKKLLGRA
ncbi:MAG: phosphatidylglycerol lysyltransferase domain-containing protein [Actinomycetota bacterium]|nr:phosphatidylglycerol lysyltransferase domain-containing protein [Actinomycetota bacterium]